MFDSLPARASAVDACATAVRKAILDGSLAPGDRLPPERDLAASFGVNRVTVRSALARLAEARLVSVRQGSGYVVRDFRRFGGPDLLAELASGSGGADRLSLAADLLLVRRQLARGVLERIGPDAAPVVSAAVDLFAALVGRGATPAEAADADADVLATVVAATGSPVLALCVNPVLGVLLDWPDLRDAIYADANHSVTAWRGLVAWLGAGAPPSAIDAVMAALAERDRQTLKRLEAM